MLLILTFSWMKILYYHYDKKKLCNPWYVGNLHFIGSICQYLCQVMFQEFWQCPHHWSAWTTPGDWDDIQRHFKNSLKFQTKTISISLKARNIFTVSRMPLISGSFPSILIKHPWPPPPNLINLLFYSILSFYYYSFLSSS